jgi:hypothetical protein
MRSTLILFFILAGAAHAMSRKAPDPTPSPSPVSSPEPQGQVEFVPVDYYSTPRERVIIKRAGAKVNEVIHSQCFSDFMGKRALIQTGGRTPTEVVKHLQGLTGLVPVKMYYRRFTSAVAYRQPPSMEINLNRKAFFEGIPDCTWAATLAHESLGHSLGGYEHDFKWNKARSFSVPYSMGGADQAQGGDAFDACCR